jgi:hypothetical protein
MIGHVLTIFSASSMFSALMTVYPVIDSKPRGSSFVPFLVTSLAAENTLPLSTIRSAIEVNQSIQAFWISGVGVSNPTDINTYFFI